MAVIIWQPSFFIDSPKVRKMENPEDVHNSSACYFQTLAF